LKLYFVYTRYLHHRWIAKSNFFKLVKYMVLWSRHDLCWIFSNSQILSLTNSIYSRFASPYKGWPPPISTMLPASLHLYLGLVMICGYLHLFLVTIPKQGITPLPLRSSSIYLDLHVDMVNQNDLTTTLQ
jgi:hypothetical protein